jgi:hypothetical protein
MANKHIYEGQVWRIYNEKKTVTLKSILENELLNFSSSSITYEKFPRKNASLNIVAL